MEKEKRKKQKTTRSSKVKRTARTEGKSERDARRDKLGSMS